MRIFSDIKISESVSIAIVPLFGYIAAFFYEAGEFNLLKVPLTYIQISIELALLSSFITLSIILIAIISWLLLNKIQTSDDKKTKKYFLNGSLVTKNSLLESVVVAFFLPIVVAALVFMLTTLSLFYIVAISVGLFILFAGLIFLPPLIYSPNEKNYRKKFDKYQEEQYEKQLKLAKIEMGKKDRASLFGLKEEHPFYSYIKLTIYLIIWATLSFIVGTISMSSSIYSITKIENKDYIVLGTYSNKFILVGINRKKRITTSEILLINNEKEIRITRENIGAINENKSNYPNRKIF